MVSIKEITDPMQSASKEDVELIRRAYNFAEEAHKEQRRLSGEPYFSHVAETAKILAEYGMSGETIAAGLLHDLLEDAGITEQRISETFGEDMLFLIQGVTKLGKLRYHGTDRHNESLRKLFVAMSEDIRVLMIKLSDRLHNIRTLSYVDESKKKRIAEETLEIYAPIAYRLGIRKLSRELEDLSFPYVYPKEYRELKDVIKEKYESNLKDLEKFLKSVKKALAADDVRQVRTEYRVKGLYSLYKKMALKKKHPDEIYDILALRIIVPDLQDCYRVLGIVHGTWRPLPGRIKDYIAFPKPNGYQALQTTIFTGDGKTVEIQIKTEEMHRYAEYGIASHIAYKTKKGMKGVPDNIAWIRHLLPKRHRLDGSEQRNEERALKGAVPRWIEELVEHHNKEGDNDIFREDIRKDFFESRIFVFSPLGDVIDLPKDSSPVDFAYSIHSDIGNHTFGSKVNGKLVTLSSKLKNGDIVEIMTKSSAKPSSKWLEYVKTASAKHKIRSAIHKSDDLSKRRSF